MQRSARRSSARRAPLGRGRPPGPNAAPQRARTWGLGNRGPRQVSSWVRGVEEAQLTLLLLLVVVVLARDEEARRTEERSVEGTKRCWAGLPAADGGAVARGRASR